MLATGGTLVAAISLLIERGADDVTAICLLAAPEGVARLERDVPATSGAGHRGHRRGRRAAQRERLHRPGPRRRGRPAVRRGLSRCLSAAGPGGPGWAPAGCGQVAEPRRIHQHRIAAEHRGAPYPFLDGRGRRRVAQEQEQRERLDPDPWPSTLAEWVWILIQAFSLFLFLGYTASAAAIEKRVRRTPVFRGDSMLMDASQFCDLAAPGRGPQPWTARPGGAEDRGSDLAEEPVARVAQAGHDVATVVQPGVHGRQPPGSAAVSRGNAAASRSRPSGAASRQTAVTAAAPRWPAGGSRSPACRRWRASGRARRLTGRTGRPGGRWHRWTRPGSSSLARPTKPTSAVGSSRTMPSSMPMPARSTGTTIGSGAASLTPWRRPPECVRPPVHLYVPGRLVRQQRHQLVGQPPERGRVGARVAQRGELVRDQRVIGYERLHER